MNRKDFNLLLIAGHGDGDPGAVGNGYYEADLTRELVKLIQKAATAEGISCTVADTSKNYYKFLKNGGYFNFKPFNYALEVHFNASAKVDNVGDGKLKGSMFFISEWEKGHSVEDAILNNLYALGSKQAWDGIVMSQKQYKGGLLVQNYANSQGVSHGLLETCFISDKDDVEWYLKKKELIAEAVVAGIIEGFRLDKEAAFEPYMVKVTDSALNIRSGAGTNYKIVGCIRDKGSYTIVEESAGAGSLKGWGKLKSGAGWISLDYCERR